MMRTRPPCQRVYSRVPHSDNDQPAGGSLSLWLHRSQSGSFHTAHPITSAFTNSRASYCASTVFSFPILRTRHQQHCSDLGRTGCLCTRDALRDVYPSSSYSTHHWDYPAVIVVCFPLGAATWRDCCRHQ